MYTDNGQFIPHLNTRTRLAFSAFIIILLILFILYFGEIKNEIRLLKKFRPYWLAAAFCCQFLTYYCNALIYHSLILPGSAAQQPRRVQLLDASLISTLFNQIMPSAGVSGNAFLVRFLAGFGISRDSVIRVILRELLIFYAAFESVIILLLAACMAHKSLYAFKSTLLAGMIVYACFALIVKWAGKIKWIDRLIRKLTRSYFAGQPLPQNNAPLTEKSVLKRSNLMKAYLYQLMGVASDVLTIYVLFLGLGYPVSLFIVTLGFVCTKIITLIPFLPGSLILYESSMSLYLANAGVPVAIAVIVTFVYRLLSFWLPMPVGTFLYRKWLHSAFHT